MEQPAPALVLAQAASVLSGVFALGGLSTLFLRYRTLFLRSVLLFLGSLTLIALGFLAGSLDRSGWGGPGLLSIRFIFHLAGGCLNIAVLPQLVAGLRNAGFGRLFTTLWRCWTGAYIGFALAFFLSPALPWLAPLLSAMQVLSIGAMLLALGFSGKLLRATWWEKSLRGFIAASLAFLLLLVLDILISSLPIPALAAFDNLSLPLYLILLNLGLFRFSGKYLSREALVQGDRLTEGCRSFYRLTPRESEIIEALLLGKANKELAAELGISVKTVENHLSSCYQKLGVQSRIQLVQTLRSWKQG